MAPLRASTTYKKKDGTLAMSKDLRAISWTPAAPPNATPAVNITVATITNLQQAPANSPKVMLRILVQSQDASAPETHTFAFTSPTAARAEADAIRDTLSKVIQSVKASSGTPGTGISNGPGAASSGPMAIAGAVNKAGDGTSGWYDDARLMTDIELQQSLLKADASLSKTFVEALRTKPESISNSQFTTQFWSSRLSLLRAHAIEKNQSRGSYNVLASIKPKTEDNTIKLNVSKEQIQLIFSQHPLVKRVYDENVPKLDERTFWIKFFSSSLFKKLKGERLSRDDPKEPLLDKYLSYDENPDRADQLLGTHVPHIIDIEGNEENHSQRKGNQPDLTMRPASMDKVPIIRSLNNLSERIMAQVAPSDVDPSQPIGLDEETFNQLALQDLRGDAREDRIILNIRNQNEFFSDRDTETSSSAKAITDAEAKDILSGIQMDLDPALMEGDLSRGIDLQSAIGVREESSDEEDESAIHSNPHLGSRAALSDATKQMFVAIKERRSQADDLSSSNSGFSTVQPSATGLSAAIYERVLLTHATTTEFLHYFWQVFLSGDPDRANEIARLAESLDRAMDRIEAVSNDAEEERKKDIEKKKNALREQYRTTGKKKKLELDTVMSGSAVVKQILKPTIEAIHKAVMEYKKALSMEGLSVDGIA